MKPRWLLLFILNLLVGAGAFAQGLPPLGQAQQQNPPAQAPAPLGAQVKDQPGAGPAVTLSVDAANADLKTARTANQEKRYTDAEALMLRDTAARPNMPPLWLELAQAQLGQNKYPEAETSFKAALSNGETVKPQAPAGGFYAEGQGTNAHASVTRTETAPKSADLHEVQGAAYSGLGEIYIHLNRIPEAKEAYDKAAAANPAGAPLYLRNEVILFLKAGNAVEQVEAANKAIAIDPTRAALYFFKGQGLAAQATIDPHTQKLVLPAGSADALQKYLSIDPSGPYSTDAKGMLAAAGIAINAPKK
jgi:tetratricopeptide (TPR) repeat protein